MCMTLHTFLVSLLYATLGHHHTVHGMITLREQTGHTHFVQSQSTTSRPQSDIVHEVLLSQHCCVYVSKAHDEYCPTWTYIVQSVNTHTHTRALLLHVPSNPNLWIPIRSIGWLNWFRNVWLLVWCRYASVYASVYVVGNGLGMWF